MMLAQKLVALRNAARMSSRQLAKAAGISRTYLRDIEGGRRVPSERFAEKIADVFGVSKSELLGHEPQAQLRELIAELKSSPAITSLMVRLCRRLKSGSLAAAELERIAGVESGNSPARR